MSIKTVFLSSTARDLAEYRQAVTEVINGLDDYKCVRMEDFGARNWEADEFCWAKVAGCDLFVGVVGHLYGSCPKGSEHSYTEREYEAAIAAKMPRLMFIAPQDFPLPASLIEPDEKRVKQHAFRDRVNAERIRDEFTSPDDLARRVVQAIRNWEQEQAAVQRRPLAAHPEGVVPLPPQPYIAHPYPAQAHFTGRERERADLTAWLADDAHPLLVVIAIGGMGKSALGWHWFYNDLWPLGFDHCGLRGALWWCFYDRESGFERFLERAIAYVSGGEMDATNWPVRDRMDCLRALLAERPFLLMLDGAERLLRAYARMDAPYLGDEEVEAQRDVHPASLYQCADPNVGTFLQWLAGLGATKTLLTSRLLPRELEGLAGVVEKKLTSMDPEDAVRFFRAMDVRGTWAEIQAACTPYGYLPLALRLLAVLVAEDPARPGDIAVATEEITEDLWGKEQHRILKRAYNALDPAARGLLSRMAAFRSPVGYGVLQAIFGPPSEEIGEEEQSFRFQSERALKDALRGLVKRGLLLRQEGTGHYDLHPVVRRYAYDRLADKEGTHTRLRDYFAAVPEPEQVESLDDLAPTLELYHHTVRAGRYDEARRLLRDRLVPNPLYYRFGAYQLIIELLRALFPGGEPFTPSGEVALPRLSEESDQAWTLNALSAGYAMSGQPSRAMPLLERVNDIYENVMGNKGFLATGLGNLATQQIAIGALAAAEKNLRRCIELRCEIGDEHLEARGRAMLGQLMAYQGNTQECNDEISAAFDIFVRYSYYPGQCSSWAWRALNALMVGDSVAALEFGQKARQVAERHYVERNVIEVEWLLGAAHRAQGELAQAEPHLEEALGRCRRINLIETEPNILLELARLRQAQAREAEALSLAQEALDIADRCEYRLVQADCYNFLAELALEAGDRQRAQEHAETARERAWCDGPPHRYEAAFQEAERLLEEIESLNH